MKSKIDMSVLSVLEEYADACLEFLRLRDALNSADNALDGKISELMKEHTETAKDAAGDALRAYGASLADLRACNNKINALYSAARDALEKGYSATAELRIPVIAQNRYANASEAIQGAAVSSK